MLADIDADLVTMLDEAMEVVSSMSTGRVRHASVSLRELATRVLHRLAPDDESWPGARIRITTMTGGRRVRRA